MLYISLTGKYVPIAYIYTFFKEIKDELEIDPEIKKIALRADSATIVDNESFIDRFGRCEGMEALSPLAKACICIYACPDTCFAYYTIRREEIIQLLVLPRGQIYFPPEMVKAIWLYEPLECGGYGTLVHQDIENEICVISPYEKCTFKSVHEVFHYFRKYQSQKGL